MKKLAMLLLAVMFAMAAASCRKDDPGEEIQLGQLYDFDGTTQIQLTNAHNGNITFISDAKAIGEITAFVGETIGKSQGSGKGYYEGSYSVTFYREDTKVFSLGFGDSDCFYMGQGNDGYPIRYHLCHRTIPEDVIPFFSQYDQRDFAWPNAE